MLREKRQIGKFSRLHVPRRHTLKQGNVTIMAGRPLSYQQLLRLPDMPALLLATCLSRLAGRMVSLSLVLYALARPDGPALAGWLAFASVAPGLVISPIAGALIDRSGAVWAIAIDMAASAICVLGLAAVDRLGCATTAIMIGIATLFSLTSPLSAAGIRVLVPRLVQTEARDRANALDTSIHGLTDVIGPALAGLLMGFVGAEPTFSLIALLYAMGAICIGRIRRPHARAAERGRLLNAALIGVVRVARHPTLRGLAVCYSLYQLTWGALVVIVPVVAAHEFAGRTGEATAGLLWASAGIVGAMGALVAGRFRILGRERRVMALGMGLTALAAGPIAAVSGVASLALGLMLVALAAGPVDVAVLTLRQRRTDPAELGRMLSVSMSLNLAGIPLGSALAGMLIARSLPLTFFAAALASVLAAGAVGLIPRDDAVAQR